ncbi:hypothetical protein H310_09900 [Aphanomyces invadans]|uniref:Kinesin motor domain-containing protein n=1 Tax=Aphanomyces invadans TaxID=157072 RepID=A0A024TSU9_9STRA|nr:hypothetical protein H310_09900 [Aphanomyces invadans]ETV97079.1 hypothetical protein H310_09900 [Aphanomyces invadans]|eukprot:XP_008874325.1 hypothetical protein H310_09900 [Aphanomyces invadans]
MDVDDLLDLELQQDLDGLSETSAPLFMAEGQETNEEKLMREALLDGASRVSISTMLRRRSLVDVETDMLPTSPSVVKALDFDDTASMDSESQYSEVSCHTEDSFMASPPTSRLMKPTRVSTSSTRSKPTSSLPKTTSFAFGSSSTSTVARTRPSAIPVPRESSLRNRSTITTTSTAASTSRTSTTSMLPTRSSSVKTASTSTLPIKPPTTSSTPSLSSRTTGYKTPPPSRSSRLQSSPGSPTYANSGKAPGFGSSSSETGRLSRSNSTSSSKSLRAPSSQAPSPPRSIVSPPTLIRGKSMSQVSVATLFKVHFTTEAEIEEVLSQPPLRAIDSKGRIDQMDKYIRKLKYRLRELKMQRDAFSLACQGVERDLTEEHAATARAYATAKQELLQHSSAPGVASSTGEPSGPPATSIPSADPAAVGADLSSTAPSTNGSATSNTVLEDDNSVLKTLDSNMQEFVRNAMERSTSQMVAKYQALLAEKDHAQETQLQSLREHYTKSMSSSTADAWATVTQLQAQTKALEADKTSLELELAQIKIDHDALKEELHDFQERVRIQDEENTSAKSFWQKSTDMIKENRRLTEEIVHLNSEVAKAQEVIGAKEATIMALQVSVHDLEEQRKGMDDEKRVWADRLTTVEAAWEEEKSRREHFQVAQHQLTQDNTAMYAQMMAMQTGCDARLEEMKAQYERQRLAYVEEVKMLQTENRVMTRHARPPAEVVEDKGELEKLSADFLEVRTQLAAQLEYVAELERQVHEGNILRRQMHNTIQELRGNVRVHVRLRPFLPSDGELSKLKASCWCVDDDNSTITNGKHRFTFDKLFGQTNGQEHIFNEVSDFIQSAIDGYHVCIFAYGQTGSGKTFTMQGGRRPEMRGIIPRAMSLIMGCCSTLSEQGWTYSLEVTFMEIYNETIRDLLSTDTSVKYNIRTDKNGKNYVENLRRYPISLSEGVEQVELIMETAACNRSVEKTDMNAESSRSHSIFTLHLHGHRTDDDDLDVDLLGSLSLVDLAGSERISRSGATGERLKEAQAINKSLSALADVFGAIAKKQSHVPYRNSKLTYVLQPALSGDGKTLMMVNLSPTDASVDESLCSLRFAQQVNACELGSAQRNIKKESSGSPKSPRTRDPPQRDQTPPETSPKVVKAPTPQPRLSITPKTKPRLGGRSIESS